MAETRRLSLEALQAENERLHERIAALEAALGCGFVAPEAWRLTRHEAAVFGILLAARGIAGTEAIMAGLYAGGEFDEPNVKIVQVWVHKLRVKLEPHGLAIETAWGFGYRLSPETKALARAQIAAAAEARAA
jgi:DNA-binding response OmpR family regulator